MTQIFGLDNWIDGNDIQRKLKKKKKKSRLIRFELEEFYMSINFPNAN